MEDATEQKNSVDFSLFIKVSLLTKLNENEVKERLFNILLRFADYCDIHSLKYLLCGGTLLGAIRHKDFIPWDDDIDVIMPRPDYFKLIEEEKRCPLGDGLMLTGYELKNYLIPFMKVIDTNTVIEEKLVTNDKNLWIDIFPVDGMPDDVAAAEKILASANRLKSLWGFAASKFGTGTNKYKAIGKIPLQIYAKLIGCERITKKLFKLAPQFDYDTSNNVAAVAWSCGKGELFKKTEYIETTAEVEFHGHMFHAPGCWDKYLKSMYGNYQELPPENKRHGHIMDVYILE